MLSILTLSLNVKIMSYKMIITKIKSEAIAY